MTYAFARQPSIASERGKGAARVLRDAYAQAWQVSARACAECPDECRELAGLPPRPPVPPAARCPTPTCRGPAWSRTGSPGSPTPPPT
nr:hypothetical protein [Actinomadura madurae]